MIKLLHAADFHLDSAFASLPPALAKQRRSEQREALNQLVKAAEGCDIVLLAGDLFDGRHVYRDTLEALKACFAAINAEIFIAPGNHDPLHGASPYLTEDWGRNVHIFTKASIERIRLPQCDVYGAAYLREGSEILEGFRVEDESTVNLMVLHTGGDYNPITPTQIEGSGLDYLALGHVHTMQVQTLGVTTYAYAGCLMGRGFDECGQKGVLRVEASKTQCKTQFVPIFTGKYEIIQVQAGDDPLASIRAALPKGCGRDCLRIILRGEADAVDTAALEQALQGVCFSLSVRDCTVDKRALWEGCGEDTLRGEVLQELKARFDAAEGEEARRIARAAKLLTDLMDDREVTL